MTTARIPRGDKPSFDKRAYQRSYMARKRAAAKAARGFCPTCHQVMPATKGTQP